MSYLINGGIVRHLGLSMVGLLLAVGFAIEAKGEETTIRVAGTLVKATKKNDAAKWYIKFDSGQFRIRTPRDNAGFTLDPYADKKVILTFNATVTTEEGKRKVTLTKTFPIALEEVKEGQELPALDPDLVFPQK